MPATSSSSPSAATSAVSSCSSLRATIRRSSSVVDGAGRVGVAGRDVRARGEVGDPGERRLVQPRLRPGTRRGRARPLGRPHGRITTNRIPRSRGQLRGGLAGSWSVVVLAVAEHDDQRRGVGARLDGRRRLGRLRRAVAVVVGAAWRRATPRSPRPWTRMPSAERRALGRREPVDRGQHRGGVAGRRLDGHARRC